MKNQSKNNVVLAKSFDIKTGDMVVVLTGKDRTKKGRVIRVVADKHAVIVEKINQVKKHIKPSSTAARGGIVDSEMPIEISNVMLICPHCDKPTRVAHTLSGDKKNVRICKHCSQMIDVSKK